MIYFYFITLLLYYFFNLWTHFWTLYFEGKTHDLKVNIDLYTTSVNLLFMNIRLILLDNDSIKGRSCFV